VTTFTNRSKDLLSIILDVDPVYLHSGSHDVTDAAITNIEDPLYHLLLRFLQEPTFLAGSDQKFEFFRGMQGFFSGSWT